MGRRRVARYFQRCQALRRSAALKFLAKVALFVAFAAIPAVAQAAITAPTSTPTINQIHANRNLVEPGDALIYGLYNLPYTALPSVDNVTIPADAMFIFRLLDSTGADVGSMTPFSYSTLGYGYNNGLISFYFSCNDNLPWGQAYTIRISQNPTYFSNPAFNDVSVPTSAWTSATSQAANQGQLSTNLYNVGQTLESSMGKTFFQTSGSAQVLTGDGELYFTGAIPGLQAMAPALYSIQQVMPDQTPESWTTLQFDQYEQRFAGTWVGDAQNAIAEQVTGTSDPNTFGSPAMIMFIIWIVPSCGGFIIASAWRFHNIEPGLVVSSLMLIFGVLMGWTPKAIFASTYQVAHIYIGYLLFLARS